MTNPKPKSEAEIIAELQEKAQQREARNLDSQSKDSELAAEGAPRRPMQPTDPLQICGDLPAKAAQEAPIDPDLLKRGPTGPLQTCGDINEFKAAKRAPRSPAG